MVSIATLRIRASRSTTLPPAPKFVRSPEKSFSVKLVNSVFIDELTPMSFLTPAMIAVN